MDLTHDRPIYRLNLNNCLRFYRLYGGFMSLIQKSAKKDCYFLAIKKTLYGKRYDLAKSRRLEKQAFIKFMKGL